MLLARLPAVVPLGFIDGYVSGSRHITLGLSYIANPPQVSSINSRIHNNESENLPVVVVFLVGNVAVVTEPICMLPDQRYGAWRSGSTARDVTQLETGDCAPIEGEARHGDTLYHSQ
jgi:hypothetical protein